MAETTIKHDAFSKWFLGAIDRVYTSRTVWSLVPSSFPRHQSIHILPSPCRSLARLRLHSVTHGSGKIYSFNFYTRVLLKVTTTLKYTSPYHMTLLLFRG